MKYSNTPCIHTQKSFYRNLIVDAQNQQFGARPTSIFPYKQCKVLFGFSRLSQHWIFSVHATLGTLNIPKKLHKLERYNFQQLFPIYSSGCNRAILDLL